MSNELTITSFNRDALRSQSKNKGSKTQFLTIPKDGNVVVRILPPFGPSSNGSIVAKHVLHWGLTNENGQQSPVKCSYHTSERYCPICEQVFSLKNELKQHVDESGNLLPNGNKERADSLKESVDKMGSRTSFFLNVVDNVDGQVKVLQIPSTAFEGMLEKIDEAVDKYKFDPTSLEKGVWFKFSKSGMGFKTKYSVDFKKITKKTADGEDAEVRDSTPLPHDLVESIKKQLSGSEGPMRELAEIYEARTARELKSFLDGAPVTSKKFKSNNSSSNASSSYEEPVSQEEVLMAPPLETTSNVKSEIDELRRKARAARGLSN